MLRLFKLYMARFGRSPQVRGRERFQGCYTESRNVSLQNFGGLVGEVPIPLDAHTFEQRR